MCVEMELCSRSGSIRPVARRAACCLGALAVAAGIGCAQLERFRRDDPPPMLGSAPSGPTAVPLAPEGAPREPQNSYAEWLERRTPALHGPNAAELAASDEAIRSTAPPYPLADDRPPAQVALQAPVALTPREGPDEATTPAAEEGLVRLPTSSGDSQAAPDDDPLEPIRRVVEASRQKLATLDNYQVQMSRQENVRGSLQPAEEIQLSIRRDPKAVRLEWLDGPSEGREVIYNQGGQMHVNMPGTLVPRISLPPDSPLALKNSRHPIDEAGFAKIIEQILIPLEVAERDGMGSEQFRYGGLVTPEPGAPPCHEIVRITPTGETWTVHIDDRSKMPYMVHAEDATGTLLEHYVFRDLKANLPELTAANAFNHEQRWGQGGGFFERLASGAAGAEPPASPATR